MRKSPTTIVFLTALGCVCALTLASFWSTDTVSTEENRTLQVFPTLDAESYLSGRFFRDLENYCYDHIPARSALMRISAAIERGRGIQPRYVALDRVDLSVPPGGGPRPAPGPSPPGSTPQAPQPPSAAPDASGSAPDFSRFRTQTQYLWTVAIDDTLFELYHFDELRLARYAAVIDEFASRFPEEVRVFSLVAPTQIGLRHAEFPDFSDPHDLAIEYLYSLMNERVETIDAFGALAEHRGEYLYFRSDHHWTQLGAYYAASEFARKAGFGLPPLSEYRRGSLEGFLGYLYQSGPVAAVAANPDRIDYYLLGDYNPHIRCYSYDSNGELRYYTQPMINLHLAAKSPVYSIFLGGDFALTTIENEGGVRGSRDEQGSRDGRQDDRVLLIVKDSYANAFIPWIAPFFRKILIVDPRFYEDDLYRLAREEGVTDFLAIDYITATALDAFVEKMHETARGK